MTNSQLIPVSKSTINNFETLTVDGRALHAFLGVRRDFSNWIKDRIAKYGFQENQDFVIDSPNLANQKGKGGDRKTLIYTLTVDMAKQLAMVENNEKGRQVRQYFIECERQARENQFSLTSENSPALDVLSTVAARKPLVDLVSTWIGSACIGYPDAWHQVFAFCGVTKAKDLTIGQIKHACAFVQERIDAIVTGRSQVQVAALPMPQPAVDLEAAEQLVQESCETYRAINKHMAEVKSLYDKFRKKANKAIKNFRLPLNHGGSTDSLFFYNQLQPLNHQMFKQGDNEIFYNLGRLEVLLIAIIESYRKRGQ